MWCLTDVSIQALPDIWHPPDQSSDFKMPTFSPLAHGPGLGGL